MAKIEAVREYISRGFAVFPAHSIKDGICTCGKEDCGSAGKHPIAEIARRGFHDATTDIDRANRWWRRYPDANIGIATGAMSGGLLVIDIDNKPERGQFGEENWQRVTLGKEMPELVSCITGSGGTHLYFRYDVSLGLRSGSSVITQAVDVRADGGYVIAPPSVHISGNTYEWDVYSDELPDLPEAPAWLIEMVQHKEQVEINQTAYRLPDMKVQEIRSALCFIDSDPRETWLNIGMALHSTRAGEQAYGLWTEWSGQSDKFNARDQRRTWQSFKPHGGISLSTLFAEAKKGGWVEPVIEVNESTGAKIKLAEQKKIIAPDNLYNPPGILNTVCRWIVDTAYIPQPSYALQATIALAGVVMGQRWATRTGLRSNVYLAAVGPTASGKQHPRSAIKQILQTANRLDLLGGERIASGQAILTRVSKTPSVLFMQDEFGLFLESIQGANAGRHNAEIKSNLMELFSSANTVYIGTEYADQTNRPRIDIPYPCVSYYGVTAPDPLERSLNSDYIVSGFLNRFLVLETDQAYPPKNRGVKESEVPNEICEWVYQASVPFNEHTGGNLVGRVPGSPITVNASAEADEMLNAVDDLKLNVLRDESIDERLRLLWARADEHVHKIALICAVAERTIEPTIEAHHVIWAREYVTYCINQLCYKAENAIGDSKHEINCKKAFLAIADKGDKGMTPRELNRKFQRLKSFEIDEILKSLERQGKIAMMNITRGTRGKTVQAYVAIEEEE